MTRPDLHAALVRSLMCAALALPAAAQWSFETLPTARHMILMTAVGDQVFFAGGGSSSTLFHDDVDVFDESTGTWSSLTLPKAATFGDAASVGTSAFFGGGLADSSFIATGEVYEYDTVTGTWTTHFTSVARYRASLAGLGQYLLVVGGLDQGQGVSDRVDVYDTVAKTWSTLTLPQETRNADLAVSGDRLIVAGGIGSASGALAEVQFVDPAAGTTGLLAPLSVARREMASGTVGSMAWFAGGQDNGLNVTAQYDLVDSVAGAQTSGPMPSAFSNAAAAVAGNRLVVAGGLAGASSTVSDKAFFIDVDGTITETVLPAPPMTIPPTTQVFGLSSASTGRSAYFAGGRDDMFDESSRVLVYTNPDELSVDLASISLTTGGTANYSLDVGAGLAGTPYILLGSVSGTTPGFTIDSVTIPLNFDPYLTYTLTNPNFAFLINTFGTVDATGSAQSSIFLPPGVDQSLAGTTLHHAAALFSFSALSVVHASNADSFDLLP